MSAAKSFPIIDDADIIDDDDPIDVSGDIDVSIEEPASETGILILDAIACCRTVAKLEDKVVLPPLPATAPRTNRVAFDKTSLARAANDVTVPTPLPPPEAKVVVVTPPLSDTHRTRRLAARSPSRFPLALCAVIAIASAVASYVVSPMASRQPAVKKATTYLVHEASAAKAWIHAAVN